MKMPPDAATAVNYLHAALQSENVDGIQEISKLPGVQEHAGMRYKLFQQASEASTEGHDVRAEYDDGYTLQCTVVVYPGFNTYISACESEN